MKRFLSFSTLVIPGVLSVMALATLARAATLAPGDILVSNYWFPPVPTAVERIDPVTGASTAVSSDAQIAQSEAIAVAPDGSAIYVGSSGNGSLFRVDPATGAATALVSAAPMRIAAMEVDDAGFIYGVDQDPAGRSLFRVDPLTGAMTTYATFASNPRGLALDPTGAILVTTVAGEIWRYDLSTGASTLLYSDSTYEFRDIAREGPGSFVIAARDNSGASPVGVVLRYTTGSANPLTVLSSGGSLQDWPWGIAVESSGSIVVSNALPDTVVRLDPATGAQQVLYDASLDTNTMGLAIVGQFTTWIEVPEPATPAIAFATVLVGALLSRSRRAGRG